MRMVEGTLNQSWPSVQTPAISVAPMPGGERAERAVRGGVRIGADHHHAGQHVPVLGQHLVADAAPADIVEIAGYPARATNSRMALCVVAVRSDSAGTR